MGTENFDIVILLIIISITMICIFIKKSYIKLGKNFEIPKSALYSAKIVQAPEEFSPYGGEGSSIYEFYKIGRNEYIIKRTYRGNPGITSLHIPDITDYIKILGKSAMNKIEQEIQNRISGSPKVTSYTYYDEDGKEIPCNSIQDLSEKMFE